MLLQRAHNGVGGLAGPTLTTHDDNGKAYTWDPMAPYGQGNMPQWQITAPPTPGDAASTANVLVQTYANYLPTDYDTLKRRMPLAQAYAASLPKIGEAGYSGASNRRAVSDYLNSIGQLTPQNAAALIPEPYNMSIDQLWSIITAAYPDAVAKNSPTVATAPAPREVPYTPAVPLTTYVPYVAPAVSNPPVFQPVANNDPLVYTSHDPAPVVAPVPTIAVSPGTPAQRLVDAGSPSRQSPRYYSPGYSENNYNQPHVQPVVTSSGSSDVVAQATGWIQNNALLAAAIAIGAFYFMSGRRS